MASVTSLGIGSGLQLNDILDKLSTAEKGSLTPISKQQSAYTAKLSAYGTLSSALSAFQTANTALNSADVFSATTAASSSTAFSATTSGNAIAGKYSISISQLAQAQTLTSSVQTSTTAALGDSAASSRSLTIKLADGTSKNITLTTEQTSLDGMRDAINGANAGVSASIIKVADGQFRLSLTSSKSGEDNAVTSLSVSGDEKVNALLAFDSTKPAADNKLELSVKAQNAKLTVNNIAISSSSNTITDALQGITLNLNDQTPGVQSLTINKDSSKANTAITNFVNAYNTLLDQFNTLTKYTAVKTNTDTQDTSNGALLGDSTLRNIQTQIKSMLTNNVSTSSYKTLAQIGISSDATTGKLSIDADKLKTELNKDSTGIQQMILGDGKTTGITTRLATNLTSWLSNTGSLQSAKDSVSKTLNNLTKQYNAVNSRIDDYIARIKAQYTNLDVVMSKLKSTSSYLTQQLENNTSNSKT